MPSLSPTMKEGTLAKWVKKEGDKIEPGQIIAEIETDKSMMEFESPDEGVLAKIIIPAGTSGVAVNKLIGVIKEDGDLQEDIDALIGSANSTADTSVSQSDVPAPEEKPVADEIKAVETGIKDDISSDRLFASPLARRIAQQKNISLSGVTGSGPGGRIVKSDVENISGASSVQSSCSTPSFGRNAQESTSYPIAPMRKVIADRLTESKQQIPHFYLQMQTMVDDLLLAREDINKMAKVNDGKPEYKISVNDMIIKATAKAMAKYPDINASYGHDSIIKYNNIDISVAVSIEGGLITPIVKNADQKNLLAISQEMKSLAKQAREGSLSSDQYQGGGFCISNMGMYNVDSFYAIVNPPQSAILAVGSTSFVPKFEGEDLVKRQVMNISLSCDHRIVDGSLAAEFLGYLRSIIEHPSLMLL